MKKVLLGALQVFVFMALYEVILYFITFVISFAVFYIADIPVIGFIFTIRYITDTILYSLAPLASGALIITVFSLIFKNIYLGSALTIYAIVSYAIISQLISIISEYGLISWDTANTIWYDIILCAFIGYGVWSLTSYNITKKTNLDDTTAVTLPIKDIAYYNSEFCKRFSHWKHPVTGEPIETVAQYFSAIDPHFSQYAASDSLLQINAYISKAFKDYKNPSSEKNIQNIDDYLQEIDQVIASKNNNTLFPQSVVENDS